MIEELTVFTSGDSSKISTWSNVPFFFTENLKGKGIKVNRVDLRQNFALRNLFDKILCKIAERFFKKTSYNYFRSYFHFIHVRYQIKNTIKNYPESDAFIFLTFSFSSAGLTKKPTILFCDWTYDHYLKYFLEKKPDFFEKQSIKREDSIINGSDMVFVLFPGVAEYMKYRYSNDNIFYLGNVVNSACHPMEKDILEIKRKSNKILFIGSPKYIEGALKLIKAFKILKLKLPSLTLNIIGIDKSNFKNLPEDVNCYGYLDKGIEKDRSLYYKLLKESRIFVNTTPKWGAFSASLEAMYFYIPVVISPYNEFIETFGESINFGAYCQNNSELILAEKIEYVICHNSYDQLCINAHNSVKGFGWNSYIDKLILKIEEINQLKK